MTTACRMSSGSNAVTTTGLPYSRDDEVVGPRADDGRDVARRDERVQLEPGRVEDRPQRRRRSSRGCRTPRSCAIPSARARRSVSAVAGAVVSKPIAKKTTSRSGFAARELERVERRVDHAHVGAAGLRLEQRAAAAGDAHHVAEGREDHLGPLGEGDRVVDAAHRDHADRAARARARSRPRRDELLDPVLVDRVRVPAADLHDLHLAVRLDERRDLVRRASAPARRRGTRRRTSRRSFSSAIPAWQSSTSPGADRLDELDRRPARGAPSDLDGRRRAVDLDDASPATATSPQVMQCSARGHRPRSPGSRAAPARMPRPSARAARASRAPAPRRSARARSRRGRAPSRRLRPRGRARSRRCGGRPRSRPSRGLPRVDELDDLGRDP